MGKDLRGLYKISEKLLYKIVKCGDKNGSYRGASRYEILSIVHFTHIADISGCIDAFRVTELCDITGCSRREAYSVLSSMVKKGFITMRASQFYGRYDICLSDSDFSTYDKKIRYLNTNREQFSGDDYLRFRSLSSTAMKLFLYLSFKYDDKYGYHVSFLQLRTELGLKHKKPVLNALNELSSLISIDDILYSIRKDEKRRLRFGFLDLPSKLITLRPNEGIGDSQATWYKRRLSEMIFSEGFMIHSFKSPGHLLNELYQIASHYLKRGFSLEYIENIIRSVIETDGCLNDRTVYNISERLQTS